MMIVPPFTVRLAKPSYTRIIPCQVWDHLLIYYRCSITCMKKLTGANSRSAIGTFQWHNKWHSSEQVWTSALELVMLNSTQDGVGRNSQHYVWFPLFWRTGQISTKWITPSLIAYLSTQNITYSLEWSIPRDANAFPPQKSTPVPVRLFCLDYT